MSLAYDDYLYKHVQNVNQALNWMRDNLDVDQHYKYEVDPSLMPSHDASKYSKEEYGFYDAYFHGGNRSYKVVKDFDYAWLHHIHNNPHHWQYWVLLEDDPETNTPYKALEIPMNYILEMIADWWSFSWSSGNLYEIFDWYADHKDKQIMHPKSREIVDSILEQIHDILDREKEEVTEYSDDHLEHHGIMGQKWGERNGPPYPLDSAKVAEKIFRDAETRSRKITDDVKSAAKKAGGEMHGLEHQLKTKESIERKLNKKINEKGMDITEAAGSIKDAIRYTVIAPTDQFVRMYYDFKDDLSKKGYVETSCDNYFDKFNKGKVKHKAVQSNFADKDGYEFEVQFHTPESQDAKDKKLPLYNERRETGISESRAKELEKQMEELALNVPDPKGIADILSHSDTEDSDEGLYGIPEIKKYPMPDKKHVISAIRFFNYVDPKYEKELASVILEKAEEFGLDLETDISVGNENRFKKYLTGNDDSVEHDGIKGMHWGHRRWQYYDGRFNDEGKRRYFGTKQPGLYDKANAKKDEKKTAAPKSTAKAGSKVETPTLGGGGGDISNMEDWEKQLYQKMLESGENFNLNNMTDGEFTALLKRFGVSATGDISKMRETATNNYKTYYTKDLVNKNAENGSGSGSGSGDSGSVISDKFGVSQSKTKEKTSSGSRSKGSSSGSSGKASAEATPVVATTKDNSESKLNDIMSKAYDAVKKKQNEDSEYKTDDIFGDSTDAFLKNLEELTGEKLSDLKVSEVENLRKQMKNHYAEETWEKTFQDKMDDILSKHPEAADSDSAFSEALQEFSGIDSSLLNAEKLKEMREKFKTYRDEQKNKKTED